jgi:hypothetical protein
MLMGASENARQIASELGCNLIDGPRRSGEPAF